MLSTAFIKLHVGEDEDRLDHLAGFQLVSSGLVQDQVEYGL